MRRATSSQTGFPLYVDGVVITRYILNLLEHLEHFDVLADDVAKACQPSGFDLEPQQSGDITKRGKNTDIAPLAVAHHGNRQFDATRLSGFCDNIDGIFGDVR